MNLFRRKPAVVAVLLAWLFATGAQWDFVQAFAWMRMLADNAQRLPLLKAVDRTFSPEGRCEFCELVSSTRQSPDLGDVPFESSGAKVKLLPPLGRGLVLEAPRFAPWPEHLPAAFGIGRAPPPLPPPRA